MWWFNVIIFFSVGFNYLILFAVFPASFTYHRKCAKRSRNLSCIAHSLAIATTLGAYSTRLLACAFPSLWPRGATLFRNARREIIYLRRELRVVKELLRHCCRIWLGEFLSRYLCIRFTYILCHRDSENDFINVWLQSLYLIKNNIVPTELRHYKYLLRRSCNEWISRNVYVLRKITLCMQKNGCVILQD